MHTQRCSEITLIGVLRTNGVVGIASGLARHGKASAVPAELSDPRRTSRLHGPAEPSAHARKMSTVLAVGVTEGSGKNAICGLYST